MVTTWPERRAANVKTEMPPPPVPPIPSTQAQAQQMIESWTARNLDAEDGAERRRRAVQAAERLVQLALSLEPALEPPAAATPPADRSRAPP